MERLVRENTLVYLANEEEEKSFITKKNVPTPKPDVVFLVVCDPSMNEL
jgi:hypothetical protein